MSKELSPDPEELLRRMASQVVPVEASEAAERRRSLVVGALGRSIREGSAERARAKRSRGVLAGLGVALALAAGVALTIKSRHTASAPGAPGGVIVSEVSGSVLVTDGADSRVLRDGSNLLLRGSGEVETVADARADVRTPKSLVHIGAASKVLLPVPTPSEERYRLMLGSVDVSVDKESRSSRAVVVETPNAEVLVRGTVFAVKVQGQGAQSVTDVSVTRGSVWVLKGGAQVAVLGAGQHWSSSLDVPASAPSNTASGEPTSKDLMQAEPARALARVDASARDKSGTLAEENKMFQDALDLRNRGDDARAAESFARLVARFPRSKLAEEAEVERLRALKRLGQLSSAASEARRYLATHPLGFARDEARGIALSATSQQH